MTRSLWKGFYVNKNLIKTNGLLNNEAGIDTPTIVKLWNRSTSVPESLINKQIFLYNGCFLNKQDLAITKKLDEKKKRSKEKKHIKLSKYCIGFKLGNFGITRPRKKKEKEKQKKLKNVKKK